MQRCATARDVFDQYSRRTSCDTNGTIGNDGVAVRGGGGRCGKGVGAQSSTPAVAVGAPVDAGPESGEGAE